MHVDAVIKHFGTAAAAARAIGLSGTSAVTNWRTRYNGLVPELYARKYRDVTRGKLKFDPKAYEQS